MEKILEKSAINLRVTHGFVSCFSGDNWHLRKTNWCGEAGEMLNDLEATLDQYQLRNGDHLLLMEGKVPPKVVTILSNEKKEKKSKTDSES